MSKKQLKKLERNQDKPKAVVDTNIFVSGTISPHGIARKILDAIRLEKFILVTSEKINEEILEVLHREHIYPKYGLTERIIDDICALLYEGSKLVQRLYIVEGIVSNSDDDKFLACALEGKADYIISSDEHLLNLKYFHGIQIVNPIDFWEILSKKT
ncbi:putative toxin-antitoxin system toxin component, PIN family [bacterium]|nr:putative toxin-antitoxin system toxin component, PIN family [bacterium]